MKKIFFVTYGGGHVNTLLPIIKQIKKYNLYEYEILALTTAAKIFDKNNIEYKTLKDYAVDEEVRIGKSIAQNFHSEGKGISYEDTVAYYGIGFTNLIQDYGQEKAITLLNTNGRKSFLPVRTMKRIINEIRPDIVVTTSSPRVEEATIIASCELGIPCIRVEQFFATRECKLPEDVIYCVMDELTEQTLLNRGVKKEKINITGQPAFDELSRMKDSNDSKFREKYNISDVNKVILFAGQHTEDKKEILNKLLKIEKHNNDITLILKPHPNEDIEVYQELISNNNSNAIIIRDDLHLLIMESDLVIIEFSTVGLETIFLNKDLITINLTGKEDIVPYAKSGAAISVDDLNKLEACIKNILIDDNVKSKLNNGRNKYKNDGKASERIVDIISNIVDLNVDFNREVN